MSRSDFDIEELSGIGRERANDLRDEGLESIEKIARASVDRLATVPGISRRLAEQMKEEVAGKVQDGAADEVGPSVSEQSAAAAGGAFAHVSGDNRHLLDLSTRREWRRRFRPEDLTPILFRPCRVDVLMVADGGLSFDEQDFGLQAFVETILQPPGPYVRYTVTLAHRGAGPFSSSLSSHPRVDRTIPNFRFDDSSHFEPDMYDQVWLFGINSFGSPSQAELRAVSEFMDGGGGLFATGDHGALGRALSGSIPRARSMRHWDDSSGEVGMNDERRNDTNRLGANAASEFDDQSDDVPQPVQPKMYRIRRGIWTVSYPHPLLCGPNGAIRVMPDHPHEGECVEPSDTSRSDTFDGYTIEEYPAASGGGSKPLPEVISTSTVPAGNTANTKEPTEAQRFGGICAYDGHRADVGRVVTDATWHHFININLVGDIGNPDPAKRAGFLYSTAGQDHLDEIKTYFRNIAVWISPEASIRCMNTRIIWDLLWHHRVIEAVSTRGEVSFEVADARYVFDVGRHARDVLGKHASQCQSRRLALDLLWPHLDERLIRRIDPWPPWPDDGPVPDPIPWTNLDPLLDLALGGALIALREEFPEPDPEIREKAEEAFDDVVERGVEQAVEMGVRTVEQSVEQLSSLREGEYGRSVE